MSKPNSPTDDAHNAYHNSTQSNLDDELAILTKYEQQIVAYIAGGYSNVEIADLLAVSKRVVEQEIAKILRKLGTGSRTQLVLWAIKHRLVASVE
jgi:DNA-binding NarL/FixJ family response regulator